jgi:glutamyl-tRNA synthetase
LIVSHSQKDRVRVRFAPSPTGFLHVGGARTAIFNWLYARHHAGMFILRIEDTDVERSTRESEEALLHDLRWLGIDWDEGPDVGGPTHSYRQSERLHLYREQVARFIAAGLAYPCYCTDDLLEAKRQDALRHGKPPHYDGTCRNLSQEGVAAMRSQRVAEVIRFKVQEGAVRISDLIRGDVEMDTDMVGDFVLLRSNGMPTYNFAAAVDDHEMGITHVLRGEEHLPNTLRQILIYHALEAPLPRFGHLPLILAGDRSKLSKRHGATSVDELRRMGLLPRSVVNYLVLLGWSHPEEKEILDSDELIRTFSLQRVSKSAAIYDRKKLLWMNGQHMRRIPSDELFASADAFFPNEIKARYAVSDRMKIFKILQASVDALSDLGDASAPFLFPPVMEEEARAVLRSTASAGLLKTLKAELEKTSGDFTAEEFKAVMKNVGKSTGNTGRDLYAPVRAAMTGAVHGPDLAAVAAVLGRTGVIERIERARDLSSPPRD